MLTVIPPRITQVKKFVRWAAESVAESRNFTNVVQSRAVHI
jgi:hypothetical protein